MKLLYVFIMISMTSSIYANREARELISDSISIVEDLIDANPGNRSLERVSDKLYRANRLLRGASRSQRVTKVQSSQSVQGILSFQCRDVRKIPLDNEFNSKRILSALKNIDHNVVLKCKSQRWFNCFKGKVAYDFKSSGFDCHITGTIYK